MSTASNLPPTLRPESLGADVALRDLPRDPEGRPSVGGIPLLCRLGKGGMGIVYYAVHPRLRREIAVKILPRDVADREPELVRRFLAEARLAASLADPHLVSVLDVDVDAGTHYYLMEYVAGESAGALLRRGAVAEREALEIAAAATRGLAAAHARGIVHRDVKPDNILIPAGDPSKAKLADLGLAKPQDASGTLGTRSGIAMGTPGYMAPEQAEDAKRAGFPADVFSMGAALYALLAGRPPFEGEGLAAILRATALEAPAPLPESVGLPTRRIVERCLHKDPARRYPDARALGEALEPRRIQLAAIAPKPASPGREPFDRALLHVERRDHLLRQGDATAVEEEARAIEELGKAIEADPGNAKILVWRGGLLMQRASRLPYADAQPLWKAARADFEAAMRADAAGWRPRCHLGDLLRRIVEASRQARTDVDEKALLAEARGHLDHAVALAAGRSAEPFLARGRVRRFLDELPGALQDFGQAALLDPRSWVVHGERGGVRHDLKDYPGAIEDFGRALALSPDNPDALVARGLSLKEFGEIEKASDDFRRALQIEPDRLRALVLAVESLLELADLHKRGARTKAREETLGEAAALADRLVRARPADADAYRLRGDVHAKRGDDPAALADRQREVDLAPGRFRSWLHRGNALMALHRLDPAEADYTRALSLNPSEAVLYYLRSAPRYLRKDLALARADLEEAVRLEPAEGDYHVGLVQVLKDLDDPELKRRCDEALRAVPESHPKRRWLEGQRRNFDL